MRAAGVWGLALSAIVLAAGSQAAHAGEVAVNPVRLKLAGDGQSGLFEVSNRSSEVSRYQVSAYVWTQDESDAPTLTPTREVVFHPQLFELQPGETRSVRYGVTGKAGEVEKAYRMIVEELPPADATPANGLRVLQRLSLPLFVAAKQAAPKAELKIAGAQVLLSNLGNVHLDPAPVQIKALGANGETLFANSWNAWYVLPGGERKFSLELPRELCAKVKSIELSMGAGESTVRATAPAPACEN